MLMAAVSVCACGRAPDAASSSPDTLERSDGGNIVRGCIDRFSPDTDYFPEKFVPRVSHQVSVEYRGHYKLLTVTPRGDARHAVRYALVQCGTPAPSGFPASRIIRVPVARLALTHSDYYGPAEQLGILDRVIAIGDSGEVSGDTLMQLARSGRIRLVGSQAHLDLETLLALRPDVILSYWSVSPEWNAPAKVDEVGLTSGAMVAHWERTPLGALDWLGVLSLFVNAEGRANAEIARRTARYDSLRTLVPRDAVRPAYVALAPIRDRWGLERLDHAGYRRFDDAGLRYAFESLIDSTTFPETTLEAALAAGRTADYWLDARAVWRSAADIAATDARLTEFRAVQQRHVWAFDQGRRPPNRIPWGDQWVGRPDDMLADLLAITHASRFPDHVMAFARRVTPPAP
jgi:iron complex transport system substrate-binding protein